ncbi:MAG: family 78 glycoside hydrolase catalytic domain [Lentisphaeria bacterium]|nr:family 78 glycoside hydrolase catalytic domain [Lentisphaeria bacterium]
MKNNVYCWEKCRWIGTGKLHASWKFPVLPAPFFRRSFEYDGTNRDLKLSFSGIGYSELYLNGEKISDGVLDPIPAQYDKRVYFRTFDLSGKLRKGTNVFGVVLGDGWYDMHTKEVWHLDKASWADYVKMLFKLEENGQLILASDTGWKFTLDGPIRFSQLRNGEIYDAAMEMPGWADTGFDDSSWLPAAIVPGPGGKLSLQSTPPCRVMEEIKPISVTRNRELRWIIDFGRNLTGWAQIKVRGSKGSSFVIRYSEHMNQFSNDIDQNGIRRFVIEGDFQTDTYKLKGGDEEIYEPHFVYHGFRYAGIDIIGEVELLEITGKVVYSSFEKRGEFHSSSEILNKLFECTRVSFTGNYTGLPTDCPHREKNGWTGDASIAVQTGLTLCDAKEGYRDFVRLISDNLRPSGQLPGIVPTTGWGYNWGGGPVWDSALWDIPYQVYLYEDDPSLLKEHYENFKRHFSYLETVTDADGIVMTGLGDWCAPDQSKMASTPFCVTAYFCREAQIISLTASLLGLSEEAAEYAAKAGVIRDDINRKFYHGSGCYGEGKLTEAALALAFDIVPAEERAGVLKYLVNLAREGKHTAQFGIVGAKYVPRVLAENGLIDDALKFFTQKEMPGWANWIMRGATSLWENWDGGYSHYHIMYGDFAAWAVRYPGGIAFDDDHRGMNGLLIAPQIPAELDFVEIGYRGVSVKWHREDGKVALEVSLPEGISALLRLPGGREEKITGKSNFTFEA